MNSTPHWGPGQHWYWNLSVKYLLERDALEELAQAVDSGPLRPLLKSLTRGFQLGRETRKKKQEVLMTDPLHAPEHLTCCSSGIIDILTIRQKTQSTECSSLRTLITSFVKQPVRFCSALAACESLSGETQGLQKSWVLSENPNKYPLPASNSGRASDPISVDTLIYLFFICYY